MFDQVAVYVTCMHSRFQQQDFELNIIATTTPVQDINSHMTLDDLCQLPLHNNNGGQNSMKTIPKVFIGKFNTELPTDQCHQQRTQSHSPQPVE